MVRTVHWLTALGGSCHASPDYHPCMRRLIITPACLTWLSPMHGSPGYPPYQVRGLTELGRSTSRTLSSALTAQQARPTTANLTTAILTMALLTLSAVTMLVAL